MPLLRRGRIAEDPWTIVVGGDPLPAAGPACIELARWLSERDALIAAGRPLGVTLDVADAVAALADDLPRLSLVRLRFPKFSDGRPFTQARLLRERFEFAGEVRAAGAIMRDQALFLDRCGFDAFEVADPADVAGWQASLQALSVFYQPTGDGRPVAASFRAARLAR